jgi:KDO2-lipid IV(A) lauroyltransferase
LHDQGADRFALESRGKFGGTLVTMKSIGKYVLKARRANRVLALLADQSPGKKEVAYWTDFLNQPTAFFMGPATLARLTRYPVYFARTRRISQGHYEAELLELCATPGAMSENELIERYAQMSEEAIRLQPESYLWSNRRWKLKPPQATRETSPDESDVVQPNP